MAKMTLEETSTVYMDGTAMYHIKWQHKPGIVLPLVLGFSQAEDLKAILESGEFIDG